MKIKKKNTQIVMLKKSFKKFLFLLLKNTNLNYLSMFRLHFEEKILQVKICGETVSPLCCLMVSHNILDGSLISPEWVDEQQQCPFRSCSYWEHRRYVFLTTNWTNMYPGSQLDNTFDIFSPCFPILLVHEYMMII